MVLAEGRLEKLDSNNNDEIINYENVRPWVRYWARYIDMYLFISFIVILQLLIFPTKQLNEIIAALGAYFIWIFLEAQLMSTWGTTPGKWLLRIKVRDSNSNKLTLKTALKRSALVWTIGTGMYIFSFITEIISYFMLRDQGITVWDRICKCNVKHEKIGSERIPVILGVLILPLFISIVIQPLTL